MSKPFSGAGRKPAPVTQPVAAASTDGGCTVATGRIARLMIGQGHGFIRLTDRREIFFHRSDVREGTSFNELAVGDSVRFELIEDRVSGARAVRVVPRRVHE